MSAISAGMLIYAATVEMIAGDFVFGELGGAPGGSGGHGGHSHGGMEEINGGGREHGSGHSHGEEARPDGGRHRHGMVWKRMLAVVSLFAGVAGMGLVGLGE